MRKVLYNPLSSSAVLIEMFRTRLKLENSSVTPS